MSHYDQFREVEERVNLTKVNTHKLEHRIQEQLNMIFNELSEIYKLLEELKHVE